MTVDVIINIYRKHSQNRTSRQGISFINGKVRIGDVVDAAFNYIFKTSIYI